MGAATNVVLYAVSDGARRPLLSLHVTGSRPRVVGKETIPAQPDETKNRAAAAARVMAAMTREQIRCDAQGLAHSSFKLVRESRAANEAGQQTDARFVALDPLTLDALVAGDKGVAELDELFKE